jgi:hypothetical protein
MEGKWTQRTSVQYQITYASQNVTPLYQEQIIVNPSLGKVIEKQLIFGPTYSYTYEYYGKRRKKHLL